VAVEAVQRLRRTDHSGARCAAGTVDLLAGVRRSTTGVALAAQAVCLMPREIDDDGSDADHLGECVVCGRYRRQIKAGTVRPCWQWQRVKETDDDDSTDA
jgi:hypothetical protein